MIWDRTSILLLFQAHKYPLTSLLMGKGIILVTDSCLLMPMLKTVLYLDGRLVVGGMTIIVNLQIRWNIITRTSVNFVRFSSLYCWTCIHIFIISPFFLGGGRRGRDRMVVGFTTTYVISAYHHWCCELEFQSGRGVHDVIKFVSDLRQVCDFLQALPFPPSIKLTTTI